MLLAALLDGWMHLHHIHDSDESADWTTKLSRALRSRAEINRAGREAHLKDTKPIRKYTRAGVK